MKIFRDCRFLFAEPLLVGSLQEMLNYPLGFQTRLPTKFGLPPLEGRSNTAEGIVIKPMKTLLLQAKKEPKRVIFKRKVEGFMEKKARVFPVHSGKKQYSKHQEEVELLKYEMYAMVTEQRLVNVVSKLGRPACEDEWEEVVEGLVGDVLEELREENTREWEACQLDPTLLGQLMQELREECLQTVEEYRNKL